MNFRVLYSSGRDKHISAQDLAEATEIASNAYPSKLFTITPIVTNREGIRLFNNIDSRFSEACGAEIPAEERDTVLRLLLREISTIRNDYWVEGDREDPINARDLARDLSNRIFEALE